MVTLSINGILKTSNNLTYDDLVILCDEYYLLHKKAPNNKDFNSKNNLPSIRCVRRILANNKLKMIFCPDIHIIDIIHVKKKLIIINIMLINLLIFQKN